jgi:hypothetical protein
MSCLFQFKLSARWLLNWRGLSDKYERGSFEYQTLRFERGH